MPTLQEYRDLMEDRPEKFDADDVHYREADSEKGPERCRRCLHFYERRIDQRGVCEVMRSEETDEDGVDPNYVCDFFTRDGESFPLQKSHENR